MTPEEFVNALREVVLRSGVDSTLSSIESPPGRRPGRELVETNAWYQALSEQDRAQLRRVAAMVAHQALFGVLAVLDGARVVEDTPDKGEFRLAFRKGGQEWELNPAGGVPLHDLLNQPPEPGVH
jgi:hypothetical protein